MARWRLLLVLAAMAGLCVAAMAGGSDWQSASPKNPFVAPATGVSQHHPSGPLDDIIYYEDWESGDLAGWTPIDITATPSAWHRDDNNAFGGSGMSWWMGDSTIGPNGGYLDHWYMVLDSPPIQLGATPNLSFFHRYLVESPAVYQGYDGWDGMNIRISTNNGSTWTVIPNAAVTPAYDRQHLFSFGSEWGEGPNVPGWCGIHPTWTQQTANLAQWANQNVKIRWAFASDPASSTPDSAARFGWMVDAIRVYSGTDTVFSTDANADDGMTPGTNVPTGGNLWRIAVDNTSPDGSHIVACNNASNQQYNPNMYTVLESPLIPLGNIGFGSLVANFSLQGSVPACVNFPDCDYFGFEVSADSGQSWCAMSNPDCDPTDTNYVFTGLPTTWALFNDSYGFWEELPFRNQALKFRFTFQSNDVDEDVGLQADGFTLTFTSGYPNDVSCYSVQVRYPNMQNRPTRIRAYIRNDGESNQSNFFSYFRAGTSPAQQFQPSITLASGATTTRDSAWTFSSTGLYTIKAYTALGTDQNLANDTSMVDNVDVQPFGNQLELGYDNRTLQYRFNYATGSGALVHFTPVADGIATGLFNVTSIKAKFDAGQPADLPIQLHVYLGGGTHPGTEVVDQQVTVTLGEVGENVWKVINTSGIPALQGISQDYWVWFEVIDTTPDPGDRYPEILGDNAEPWTDIHNYEYDGTTNAEADFFYQIHSVIDVGVAADDVPDALPSVWALDQNYPNPFNPVTDIRYSVPKAERVTLKVFNLVGQEVAELVNSVVEPGTYTAKFDASQLPSGLYFYRLESASFSSSRKMMLLK